MTNGLAIAVIASGDYRLLGEFSLPEALSSSWSTLLVAANWYGRTVLEVGAPKNQRLRVKMLPSMDQEWASSFSQEVATLALAGSMSPPEIKLELVGFALYIILELAKGYLTLYAEMRELKFEEAIEELRLHYLQSLN